MIGRSHGSCICPIQMTDFQMEETHRPDSLCQREESQRFSGKGIADETAAAFPNDFAIGMNSSDGLSAQVAGRRDLLPIVRPNRAVMTSRDLLTQGFMRALLIIITTPALKAPLLGLRVGRRWPQGVRLEDAVVLFVGGILLRLPFGRKFHSDAQTPPPDAQSGQFQRSGRSPRHSMIATDDLRTAITAEKSFKKAPQRRLTLMKMNAYTQYVTRKQIPHGQGMDSSAIPRTKAAFIIHRPNFVGPPWFRQFGPSQTRSQPSPPARLAQLHLPQPASQRGQRWTMPPRQKRPQFLRSPLRISPSCLAQAFPPECRPRTSWMMRRTKTNQQPTFSLSLIASPKPITGLTGKLKSTTQGRERRRPARHDLDKFSTSFHRNNTFGEGHIAPKNVSQIS